MLGWAAELIDDENYQAANDLLEELQPLIGERFDTQQLVEFQLNRARLYASFDLAKALPLIEQAIEKMAVMQAAKANYDAFERNSITPAVAIHEPKLWQREMHVSKELRQTLQAVSKRDFAAAQGVLTRWPLAAQQTLVAIEFVQQLKVPESNCNCPE